MQSPRQANSRHLSTEANAVCFSFCNDSIVTIARMLGTIGSKSIGTTIAQEWSERDIINDEEHSGNKEKIAGFVPDVEQDRTGRSVNTIV
jgi:hypothetical protein